VFERSHRPAHAAHDDLAPGADGDAVSGWRRCRFRTILLSIIEVGLAALTWRSHS